MAEHIDIGNAPRDLKLKKDNAYYYQVHDQRAKEGKENAQIQQDRPIALQNSHDGGQRHGLTNAI